MPPRQPKPQTSQKIESFKHNEEQRKHIPTAEFQSVMAEDEKSPIRIAYQLRNRDLDPQLVWRGKDEQDWSDLVVSAPPLYIQEKIQPQAIIEDLRRQTDDLQVPSNERQLDLFADFNGLPKDATGTEFYHHDANWTNRMILGDSLQVMASLAEREGLRGKVQCIYLDPPYGIKFNSNFQWSTTSRDVKDGKVDQITREPEQVKAFRDTWRDGIHSYLTYLRDRLTVARDLLTDSGSIFLQIGEENVHRIRTLMDEVFGEDNFVALISFRKKLMPLGGKTLEGMADYLIWYSRNISNIKYRQLYVGTDPDPSGRWTGVQDFAGHLRRLGKDERTDFNKIPEDAKIFGTVSQWAPSFSEKAVFPFTFEGTIYNPTAGRCWITSEDKMERLTRARRLFVEGTFPRFVSFHQDFCYRKLTHPWRDTAPAQDKNYVVETNSGVVQRCILMTTDPGDLVLDPTCGSGTTAYVAEQWGRRWITIDTSRVALALARARIMGARYPYYLLADSHAGQQKEAEITRTIPATHTTYGNIRQGFVYDRVPHITLKSIANNAEIDVIWEKFQTTLEPLRQAINAELGTTWEEWEIPREADLNWSKSVTELHTQWWRHRIARQKEIDASIAAKADQEFLYDKPYENKSIVRVAGPFTVESLSPHRVLAVDENDELIDPSKNPTSSAAADFATVILENLRTAGVQQAHKEDKIVFTTLTCWPGQYICAEGRYLEGETEKRAGIFIGPEFGTVSRPDLVAATREAGDAGFDVLIACAFSFDAHSADFTKLGRIPVLKARMNADLHMADDLKNTGAGNLFVIFGEPDIDITDVGDRQIQVKINGVDVFRPQSGEVESSGADGIACWFIDTDYNEESFFVRHAYFLGASDPYKSLKTTLKAEIDEAAWESLYSDTSRPFTKPKSGRIAVKVINHLGDEVMKVFSVSSS
ncbi:site-specific DNA-methyltransferase [Chamaesiphon sp.]|uniref:site-specific DNA-methyltransferase n=1 Tax=Chamaesiphon sp. TaxID=2814140 RepID=UPI003592F9EF